MHIEGIPFQITRGRGTRFKTSELVERKDVKTVEYIKHVLNASMDLWGEVKFKSNPKR